MKGFRSLLGVVIVFTSMLFVGVNATSNLSVQSYSFSQAILKPSVNITSTVNIKNDGVSSETYIVAMALYGPNNILKGITNKTFTTTTGATTPANVSMMMPSNVNGFILKVFLWSDLGVVKPHSAPITVCSLDDITSTQYAPWWRQLNMACQEEVAIARKGGEAGQMVWAFAVSPTNPRNLLIGTDTSGVWRSSDAGATWVISSSGLNIGGTVDITYDPDNGNVAYVAASPNNSSNPTLESSYSGIYKSTDGGVSWRMVLNTSYYRTMTNKIIKFGNINGNGKRTIYAGTHTKGIYKSEDGGETWIYLARLGDTITDLYVNGTTIIEASLESGVMASADSGLTWQAKNGFASGTTRVTSIAVNPKDSQNWYAVENNTSTGKVYKTINSGTTWTALTVPTTNTSSGFKFYKINFGAIPTSGNPILYLSLNGSIYSLRRSADLGATWSIPTMNNSTSYFKSNTGWFAESIALHPTDPNIVWAPFDNSIYKSFDGGLSYTPSGSGFSGFRASDFLFDKYNSGNIYLALIDRGISKSVDVGIPSNYPAFYNPVTSSIRYAEQQTVHSIARDPANSNHLIINVGDWGANTILMQSFDNGVVFSQIPGTESKTYRFIEYHPQNNKIIYAGKNYSSDGGTTWKSLAKSVAAVSPFNGDAVWAVEGNYIYKSTDRGQTWGVSLNSTPIYGMQRILADNTIQGRLWIGTYENGIYVLDGSVLSRRGTAEGLVKNINGVLGIYDIAQDPKDGRNLVAGGVDNKGLVPTAGLFESFDGGDTWHVVPGMPGIRDIWRVKFHPTLPQVYVATSSGTFIYDYSLTDKAGMSVSEYSSTTLTAVKDTYIQTGSLTDFDASDLYNLRLKNTGGTGDWKAFIQFDLSSISKGTIVEANIQFVCNALQGPQTVQAYEVTNYTWPNTLNDSGMNSGNAPAVGAAISGATSFVSTTGPVNISISPFVATQFNGGNKIITVALLIPTQTGQYVLFNSKEDSAKAPKLTVRYK